HEGAVQLVEPLRGARRELPRAGVERGVEVRDARRARDDRVDAGAAGEPGVGELEEREPGFARDAFEGGHELREASGQVAAAVEVVPLEARAGPADEEA